MRMIDVELKRIKVNRMNNTGFKIFLFHKIIQFKINNIVRPSDDRPPSKDTAMKSVWNSDWKQDHCHSHQGLNRILDKGKNNKLKYIIS